MIEVVEDEEEVEETIIESTETNQNEIVEIEEIEEVVEEEIADVPLPLLRMYRCTLDVKMRGTMRPRRNVCLKNRSIRQ